MTRIVFISDTHSRHDLLTIPDGDILIHCGDATMIGTLAEIRQFNDWFSSLPHQHKVFCAGNHDLLFERNPVLARSLLSENITYLQDAEVTISGLRIYASPWQPRFFDWAFNRDRDEDIKQVWDLIPDSLDILVTHGPPFGVLDLVGGGHKGCEMLAEAVSRIKPRIHAFGHIHEGYGSLRDNGIQYINASNVDAAYRVANQPIAIEI